MKCMALALYSRVSTGEQNPEPQLHALREYAVRRGCEALEFVDHGVSGSRDSRPALDRLLTAARRREVDAVVITKLDRLARSVRHLTQLTAELEALGVDLVVLDQGIDTSTPTGRLLFNVLGSIAEFERDLIRERVRGGLQAARRRGTAIGRPRVLGDEDCARILRLRGAGQSLRAISRVMGCSKSTVERALSQNPGSTAEVSPS